MHGALRIDEPIKGIFFAYVMNMVHNRQKGNFFRCSAQCLFFCEPKIVFSFVFGGLFSNVLSNVYPAV